MLVLMTGWRQSTYNKTEEGFRAACMVCCLHPVSVECSFGQLRYRIQEQLGAEIRFVSLVCFGRVHTQKENAVESQGED